MFRQKKNYARIIWKSRAWALSKHMDLCRQIVLSNHFFPFTNKKLSTSMDGPSSKCYDESWILIATFDIFFLLKLVARNYIHCICSFLIFQLKWKMNFTITKETNTTKEVETPHIIFRPNLASKSATISTHYSSRKRNS